MDFLVGTFIGMAALVVAYLTYRSQVGQSFKRIHYSSFTTSFIVPRSEEMTQSIVIRCQGEELINPLLCVARFENTGRSPIVPSDFNSPISICLRGLSVFRTGILSWNRPGIIDIDRYPDVLDVDIKKGEINIGPTLLNPRDSVTMTFIADAVPDEFDLEVVGRVAGIEQMVRLPKPSEGIMATVNGKYMPVEVEGAGSQVAAAPVSVMVFILPIIANPEAMFSDGLEVLVSGTIVNDAHLASVIVSNEGTEPFSFPEKGVISLQLPQSRVIRLVRAQVESWGSSVARTLDDAAKARFLSPSSHGIKVSALTLAPGEFLRVECITSGNCRDLMISPRGIRLRKAELLHFEVDNMIEKNLSETEPRIFLTNQRIYRLGRSLMRKFPWLLERVRQPLRDTARPNIGPDTQGPKLPD